MNAGWFSSASSTPSFAMYLGLLVCPDPGDGMYCCRARSRRACSSARRSGVGSQLDMTIHQSHRCRRTLFRSGGQRRHVRHARQSEQSGLRVQGETFDMHALPGNKKPVLDDLKAFSNGFGGDPINFAKMDFSKAKFYEFSGTFRRDRRYFDYDLLGNPGIPCGYSIPISGSATPLAWPQMNAVALHVQHRAPHDRHQPDPASAVEGDVPLRVFEEHLPGTQHDAKRQCSGRIRSSSCEEYQRNSTDDYTGAVDWKPVQGTKLTYEEQIDHYKGDSYFTLAPQYFTVQESDGTKVALLDQLHELPALWLQHHHGRICARRQRLQHHQHDQLRHGPLCQSAPADCRSSIRRATSSPATSARSPRA